MNHDTRSEGAGGRGERSVREADDARCRRPDAPGEPGVSGRRGLLVFRASGRAFTAGDVLATLPAVLPPPAPGECDESAVEAAVADYRYARDLVSAEECEEWLARRGLDYADLVAYARRRLCGAHLPGPPANVGALAPAADADALADALLDPAFDAQALELARLVAFACEQGETLADVDPATAWPHWQVRASTWLQARTGSGECRRELERNALAWTRLGGVLVEFDDAAAAREARACVEVDGEDLGTLASAMGFPWREFRAESDALPPVVAGVLAHAATGSLQLADLGDGRHCLVRLLSREPPSLDDPEIAARVHAALRARALDVLVGRHVHWLVPLHLA